MPAVGHMLDLDRRLIAGLGMAHASTRQALSSTLEAYTRATTASGASSKLRQRVGYTDVERYLEPSLLDSLLAQISILQQLLQQAQDPLPALKEACAQSGDVLAALSSADNLLSKIERSMLHPMQLAAQSACEAWKAACNPRQAEMFEAHVQQMVEQLSGVLSLAAVSQSVLSGQP